ncbi:hypothetical protein RHMOL_Rhmol08G0154900 [Rhododendron molle]|uniref:Uncharacterized protein n=1 Tax=Rhododendron molle TaxID=49168 RepID=A0ACC0MP33_RHOML|nr:hypothetical protein RHMOL_Rhmol08G0154900 [Rhododendron molle]
MVYPELMIEEWYAFLNDIQSEDIVWRCLWLNLPAMTVNSVGFKRVILAGLTSFTFYILGQTLRQLGRNQESRCFGRERFGLPTFDSHNLQAYQYSWNNRELEEPLPDPITWLESHYVKWLHREVKARLGDTSESAVRFWDPAVHEIRFGDNELCPTVEEFQAHLQSFASHTIVVPPYRKSMSKLLKTSMNITTGAAESLLSDGQVNIMRLMERNVVPMVLAETLVGLDLVANGQTMIFGGSPLLLQLWLSDKFGLIAAPEVNWPRLPGRMHQREMLYLEMSTEEWIRFLDELSPEEITWRHEVLDIPDMAVKSAGYDRVAIAGLCSFTFYIPGCILQQLGISQRSHRVGVETFHVPAFTAQNLIGFGTVLRDIFQSISAIDWHCPLGHHSIIFRHRFGTVLREIFQSTSAIDLASS